NVVRPRADALRALHVDSRRVPALTDGCPGKSPVQARGHPSTWPRPPRAGYTETGAGSQQAYAHDDEAAKRDAITRLNRLPGGGE
ncbi:MAG TPA: hypothetical protein VKV80_16080, partial [Streptosporangiaceae bacterium]|nr:hypothetical protein [Streptosporangiaceae bacterium]